MVCISIFHYIQDWPNIVPSAVFEIIPVIKDEEDVKDVKVEKCESEDETEIKAEVKDERE